MPTVPPPQTDLPGQADSGGARCGAKAGRAGEEPAWPLWTILAAVPLGIGIGFVVSSVVVGVIAAAEHRNLGHLPAGLNLAADVIFDLGFVAAAVYVLRWTGRVRIADFGFRRVRAWTGVGAVVSAAVGYYVITAAYAALFHLHGNEKLPRELGVGKSTAALAAAAVFVCVIAPVAEEFFFRGFVFGVLRRIPLVAAGRDLGPWLGAVLTGLLFGLAHASSAQGRYLIPLAFLGFVLCLVRWRTGSLYPCIALHSLNNALALGVGQLDWSAPEVAALAAGSVAVVLAVTLPLAPRRPARVPGGAAPV